MYDAIVIGVGGVGSFALRALAKQGKEGRFLGIERFAARGHAYGSSHGKTRIYRRAYFENPSYVPWIEFSLQVFEDMQKEHGLSLMQECGTLLIEPATGSTDLPPLCEASCNTAQEYGIPIEYLDTKELPERYPQFNYWHEMVGLLEPGGGILRPELIMQAAQDDAQAAGNVEIVDHAHVVSIQQLDNGIGQGLIGLRVKLDSGEEGYFETRCLLVCMGGWTGQLISSWAPFLSPVRQIQGWIDVSQADNNPGLYGYEKMPTWVAVSPDWPLPLYGLPCDSDDPQYKHWMKAGIHGRSAHIHDPTTNPSYVSAAELEEVRKAVSHGLDRRAWKSSQELPDFVETVPCMYTMTPDADYVIGTPKDMANVFCVAGLSGHGFKNTPALGQMMADFALGEDLEPWKTDFCSPDRFDV